MDKAKAMRWMNLPLETLIVKNERKDYPELIKKIEKMSNYVGKRQGNKELWEFYIKKAIEEYDKAFQGSKEPWKLNVRAHIEKCDKAFQEAW